MYCYFPPATRKRNQSQMEPLSVSRLQTSPVKDYEKKLEERAEKLNSLSGRKNVTSCRSPTRELDIKEIKYEIQYKRDLEFLRRRSISPEQWDSKPKIKRKCQALVKACGTHFHDKKTRSEMKNANNQEGTISNGFPLEVAEIKTVTHRDTRKKWVSMCAEKETLDKNEKHIERNPESVLFTSTSVMDSINTMGKASKCLKTSYVQKLPPKRLQDTSAQTEPGFITIKTSDIQLLADYLQEALWREEALKNKLDVLKSSASTLLNSSEKLWTSCFNEDLLRNQIKALEEQLQVSKQKFPPDNVKKFVLQMEKQKVMYEEKALAAIQRATSEKTEALRKTEILQGALQAVKADASRWQGLYEELIKIYSQQKKSEELSTGHVQQLQSQLELSRGRETWLTEELDLLQCERKERDSRITQIVEDNQALRQESLKEQYPTTKIQEPMFLKSGPSERHEKDQAMNWGDRDDQFRQVKSLLQLKERECENLQTALEVMEQEFRSSQGRLAQCRDELVKLSQRQSSSNHSTVSPKKRPCGSWCVTYIFLGLVLVVIGAAMWLWHPPFRDQVEDLFSDIIQRIEEYMLKVKESQHSQCFKPI